MARSNISRVTPQARKDPEINATRDLITRRWPESTFHDQSHDRLVFTSGIAPFVWRRVTDQEWFSGSR